MSSVSLLSTNQTFIFRKQISFSRAEESQFASRLWEVFGFQRKSRPRPCSGTHSCFAVLLKVSRRSHFNRYTVLSSASKPKRNLLISIFACAPLQAVGSQGHTHQSRSLLLNLKTVRRQRGCLQRISSRTYCESFLGRDERCLARTIIVNRNVKPRQIQAIPPKKYVISRKTVHFVDTKDLPHDTRRSARQLEVRSIADEHSLFLPAEGEDDGEVFGLRRRSRVRSWH